jgi:hypothetical protein
MQLCRGQQPFRLYMGTVYNGLDDPRATIRQVNALGLNTIRITDFLEVRGPVATAPYDEGRWRRVDRLLAAAAAADMEVELDLSCYRNLLQQAGFNPYAYDWAPFLRFVTGRVNTSTGVRYGNDPTIALVAFAGEVDAIRGGDNTYGLTTSQLTEFFRNAESTWRRAAPRQLLTPGGLMQLDWDSGVDWRSIFALPDNDVDAIHVYSAGDRDNSLPAVARYSKSIGKPWITEEFGYPAAIGDRRRATNFATLFELNQSHESAGVGFWNVGRQRTDDTHDVGPQFPVTFHEVLAHRPR